MDIIAGLLFGFGIGVGLIYFLTPPEYRAALMARVHTKAAKLKSKIAAKIADIKDDDDPPKP